MPTQKKARLTPPDATSLQTLHKSLHHLNSSFPRPTPSLLHLPLEIRHLIYTHTYRSLRSISLAHDTSHPETWLSTDDPTFEAGELIRLRSPHQITGLQHTCRQLRFETREFDPLFKSVEGDVLSLLRLVLVPGGPLGRVRSVTIYLRPGDTAFLSGRVTVSSRLGWLVGRLVRLKGLSRVSVEGHICFCDAEEHAAFAAIWASFGERVRNLDIVFTPSKVFGSCAACGKVVCRCLTQSKWGDYVTMVVREV